MARLEELERKFEENPRRYFAPLANEYRKAGDARRAADLCRSQLPEVPGHISGHIVLGQALYDARDFGGSRAALETALALDPENIVALRYLGDIARDTGDAAEAERWYSRTLEADPYNEAATTALQVLRSAPAGSDEPSPAEAPQVTEEAQQPAGEYAHPVDETPQPADQYPQLAGDVAVESPEPRPATDSLAAGFEPTSHGEPGPAELVEVPSMLDAAPPVEIADAGPTEGVAEVVSEGEPDSSREVRKVLAMAREEASRLHHEYVGTEHILLGLIREREGVAATVLQNLNVDLDELRQRIDETVKRGRAQLESDFPYTSRAKKVLELAMAEARDLSHSYVGTEHLLLGLLREEKGIAAQVLADAGINLDAARAETLRLLGTEMPQSGAEATEAPTEPLEQATEAPAEPVEEAPTEAPEAAEPALQAAPEIEPPASGVLTVTGEFAGDLSVSTAPEATEPAVDEPGAVPATTEPASDAPAASAPEVERFDVAAHGPPEPETPEEAIQAEERVLESAAPFVTETMADLYLEQGYPHEALELLLQLAEQRPHDEQLRVKIEHIESVILARRDAAVAAARAERAESAEAAAGVEPREDVAEVVESVEPPDAPFDAAVAEVDWSAFAPSEPEPEEPISVREMFARMDRARPRVASSVTPRPISRRRSDFVPMPEGEATAGEGADDPFAFPSPPAPVPRTSGPQQTFNPSTADSDDFDAWLRGLRGP